MAGILSELDRLHQTVWVRDRYLVVQRSKSSLLNKYLGGKWKYLPKIGGMWKDNKGRVLTVVQNGQIEDFYLDVPGSKASKKIQPVWPPWFKKGKFLDNN